MTHVETMGVAMRKLAALSLLLALAISGCGAPPAQSSGSTDADAVREFHERNRITYDYGDDGLTTPEGRDDIPVAPESPEDSSGPQATSGGSTGSVVMDDLKSLSEGVETSTFSGSGDDTFSLPQSDTVHLYRFTCSGDGIFTLIGYNADGQSLGFIGEQRTATTGTFTDADCFGLPTDVQVQARGDWTIEVAPIDETPRAENGGTYTGSQVLYIDEPSISKITFRHDGDWLFNAESIGIPNQRKTILANATEPLDSTHVLKDSHCLLIVEVWDDVPWTVSWE